MTAAEHVIRMYAPHLETRVRVKESITRASIACCLAVLPFIARASAGHLLPPTNNRVSVPVTLPTQYNDTLSIHVKIWLQNQGVTYLIPPVPREFPPVKEPTAARVAAMHTPVGPRPVVREIGLIVLETAILPLRVHHIYWAVVLGPGHGPRQRYYVTFVQIGKPIAIGFLVHAR
jgi:hypothetical protein